MRGSDPAPFRSSVIALALPDIDAWLERHREALIRRWLAVVVERSSLDELGARPLGEWVDELTARLDAGVGPAALERGRRSPHAPADRRSPHAPAGREAPGPAGDEPTLEEALDRELAANRPHGRPFAVAVLGIAGDCSAACTSAAGPGGWPRALREAANEEGKRLLEAGQGLGGVLLPRTGPLGARAAADRLRVAAWRRLGERGPLADVGLAVHPDDGASGAELMAAALARLRRAWESPPGPRPDD